MARRQDMGNAQVFGPAPVALRETATSPRISTANAFAIMPLHCRFSPTNAADYNWRAGPQGYQQMTTQLNNEQVNRYKRHLILPEVGMEGQKKLLNAKVL